MTYIKPDSGIRDVDLAWRHKHYGQHVPATDVDHLLIEFDYGMPVALVEQKHANWHGNLASYGIKALKNLGQMSGLPVFIAQYRNDYSRWRLYPLNERAQAYVKETTVVTELAYAELLYKLRNRTMPDIIRDKFNADGVLDLDAWQARQPQDDEECQ